MKSFVFSEGTHFLCLQIDPTQKQKEEEKQEAEEEEETKKLTT